MTVINEFRVTGMSCGHCESSVRAEVGRLDGVESVEVSAQSGLLRIESAGALADADVLAAVDAAGYEAARA
ncbi:MAG: cation transporter [Microbacterium sp.]